MSIKDSTDLKVKKLFEKEALIDFPHFLMGIRKAYGRTRRDVCEDMNFSEMRMFCLEKGLFRRPISTEEFRLLGDYYGVPPSLLNTKATKFMEEGKNKSQGHYVRRKEAK